MINKHFIEDLCNIYNDEKWNNFSENIDHKRNQIYDFNRTIIKNNVNSDVQKFNFNGRFEINIDGLVLQCLFCGVNDSNNLLKNNDETDKYLYVSFNGARSMDSIKNDKYYTRPSFPRWSYYPLYDGFFLGIDDPMYKKYNNLQIGWYYGDKETCYMPIVIKLIKQICENKNIKYENVIFFSSSAGGYASIVASILLKNSLSISINPQMFIQNHSLSKNFMENTGIDLSLVDIFNRNNLYKKIKMESNSKHVIIVNASSKHDFRDIKLFADKFNIKLRYGLNQINNILIWIYEAQGIPTPHTSFETKYIYCAIDFIATKFKNSKYFASEKYQKFAIFINECWKDLYDQKKMLYDNIHNSKEIKLIKDIYIEKNIYHVYRDITIQQSKHPYNHIVFDVLKPNCIYSFEMKNIYIINQESTNHGFTCGVYDFDDRKMIKSAHILLNKNNKYYFNIVTNNNVSNIKFLIYSGFIGNASDIILKISEINVRKIELQ